MVVVQGPFPAAQVRGDQRNSMASNMALPGQPLEAALQLTKCIAPLPTRWRG